MNNKMSISTKVKYLKISNRNHRAKEHSNWIENFNGRIQNHARLNGTRISKLGDRMVEFIQSGGQKEREDFKTPLYGPIYAL